MIALLDFLPTALQDEVRKIPFVLLLLFAGAVALLFGAIVLSFLLLPLTLPHMRALGVSLDTSVADRSAILDTTIKRWSFRAFLTAQLSFSFAVLGGLIWAGAWLIRLLVSLLLWSVYQIWFVPIGVVSAYCLFLLRSKVRWLYGLIEVTIGVAAIWSSVKGGRTSDLAHFIGVLSGIYIIVRGFDNFDQGLAIEMKRLPPRELVRTVWAGWQRFKLEVPHVPEAKASAAQEHTHGSRCGPLGP